MNKARIVVTLMLLVLAVLVTLWLGDAILAFNSPVPAMFHLWLPVVLRGAVL